MKCICGYSHLPNNTILLKSHIESCLSDGLLSTMGKDPVVIWKDGEFQVVLEAEADDAVFDVGYVKPEHYINKLEEVVMAQTEKLENSQKVLEDAPELSLTFDGPADKTIVFAEEGEEPAPKVKRTRRG